ncbi:hypothetical protein [Flavobacterium terrigena]|uniref:Uncharacterized protein n=1 Tax=Flavobacterium terrigena TaxID=402734 RepID=A0A1H6SJ81_9FLAO|nr:hypothetical protein [Flavobacterium terrigena]SEI63835.1 hypothetical protein SAMN05660918_1238 [Flavobacterium terrigena]
MKTEKNEVKEWFRKFRPDLEINETFIGDLFNEYISRKESLSLDEKNSFYSYVVFNYKSEMINLIYSILEGNENYNAMIESWVEENCDVFHIGNILELIDKNDPIENQENYPHLDFNKDEDIKVEYLKIVGRYIEEMS